jgi:hypothetical protein
MTLADAVEKLEIWKDFDNVDMPHGGIGNKQPIARLYP